MAEELEKLRRITPDKEYAMARALVRSGGVHPLGEENGMLRYAVDGEPRRVVRLRLDGPLGGRCSCDFFVHSHKPCRHVAAALMYALSSGAVEETRRRAAREHAPMLLDALEHVLPAKTPIALEPTLVMPVQGGPMCICLRVGQERMYVVKSFDLFLSAIHEQRSLPFGKRFTLEPWMGFSGVDAELMNVLEDAAQIARLQGRLKQTGPDAGHLPLSERFVKRVLNLLMDKPFRLQMGDVTLSIPHAFTGQVELLFSAVLSGRELELTAQMPRTLVPLCSDGEFVFCDGDVLRLPAQQQSIVRLLCRVAHGGQASFRYALADASRVVSDLLPALERAGTVTLGGSLAERILRRPLTVKAYFDRSARTVLCRMVFHYGEAQVNPFAPGDVPPADGVLLLRDAEGERRALDLLAAAGFRMQQGRIVLSDQEDVYRFLTEGIHRLQEIAEVYCSEDFKRMTPRKPNFVGTLRMQGGALQLELTQDGEPEPEVLQILQALRERKRYFRLHDGTFLSLTDMDNWRELAQAVDEAHLASSAQDAQRGIVKMASYRAAYMDSLLQSARLPVKTDSSVTRLVEDMHRDGDPCPQPLASRLRPYQTRGFMWLQALARLGMGGVLADDMGLGKTLQIIALLVYAARRQKTHTPSIVVVPSSLLYNWLSEIQRFAPELHAVAAEGTQDERAQAICRLRSPQNDVDVYITSYPLIRRDIAALSAISFRYAILDEAQYIKNAMSVGANAVKQLRAGSRFALTGTPMENHPGELWSIFDFVLPGYLCSYAQFMHRYGQGENSEALRRRIRPFLLRRLKNDVLRELPEKMETRLLADMTREQQRVYQASLLKARDRVEGETNRIELLAAITQLRQICAHPSLVLPDYAASSGKLDLLMDILPGALEAGHRALLFSPFTRMLHIMQRRLEAAGIACLYLDGETAPKQRMALVERFNAGEGQVFLISLKAGGAGLNLVGADTVIHYDPWWNPAAEDQATDRAHRIGQKKPVTVIRLITRGTIEEQVLRLSERKRELFDRMITAGETLPTQLTQEDIRFLFS